MKIAITTLFFVFAATKLLAQDEIIGDSIAKKFPCTIKPELLLHRNLLLKQVAEQFMKEKDMDCDISDFQNQIKSKHFVIANIKNTDSIIAKASYLGIFLKYKINLSYAGVGSDSCNQINLTIFFIEGRSINDWSSHISSRCLQLEHEIYDKWYSYIKAKICTL